MDKKFRFSDTRLSKIRPPEKGRVFYYDTHQPGLRLQVTPTGAKSFQLYTWSNTHKRPMTRTLGRYPAMTIGAAREQGAKELRKIQGGIDIVELRRQKKAEWTLLKAFHEWDENHTAMAGVDAHYRVERTEEYLTCLRSPGKMKDAMPPPGVEEI